MHATVTFTTGLDTWRGFGTWHLQATLHLNGLELDDIQVTIRAGVVRGQAQVSGDDMAGEALAEILTERCQFDEAQVAVHSGAIVRQPPKAKRGNAAQRARLVKEGRGEDGRPDGGAGDLPDAAAGAGPDLPEAG